MGQRENGKSEPSWRGPVKRKEPSELSEGDKKRQAKTGTHRDKTGSSAKRLKKDKLWQAAGLQEEPREAGDRRQLPAPLLPS